MAKRITLDCNYRCAKNIINASSLVIAKNENRFLKAVKPARNDEGVAKVIECEDRIDETTRIIDFIKGHSDELNEIAIITRTNKIAAYYAQILANHNIEFRLRERYNNVNLKLQGSDDGKNAVNIMTMHASKGLEFKYVLLPDVIEGRVVIEN